MSSDTIKTDEIKIEQRRARRVTVRDAVTIVGLRDSQPAVLKNISRNGLSCYSREFIPEMTQVALAVRLPALRHEDKDFYLFRCKGAVVRCDAVTKNNSRPKWEVGVFFTDLGPEALELLEGYIASRS
jgi:hypothetical protein